jgi:hypothetical protein
LQRTFFAQLRYGEDKDALPIRTRAVIGHFAVHIQSYGNAHYTTKFARKFHKEPWLILEILQKSTCAASCAHTAPALVNEQSRAAENALQFGRNDC